ncbi:ribonuclease HII [Thiorhodovibrio frisius]|uniref:Ribonuclease HII n=1 Tax=Thiorhodovibrio frisius TaxID=631362 RepID=H8Z816_9GAMM|nr:ribonuclease HII [Thiorhodovibrio frisius]EIC19951.1 ribonuclease HII [Thiorhodovibrio frisius]WPL20680.1 Ribonuclease HII [Thiorhodovibrio frisius]
MSTVLRIAGVDEAGRGPLAGPVVAAAVILNPNQPLTGLADSKKLSATQREHLDRDIRASALGYAIAMVSAADIDQENILNASLRAMREALHALQPPAEHALIDGNRCPRDLRCRAEAIVRGDASEPAISAASILAKVARDRLMLELEAEYPGYGFARHKGYPTKAHLEALQRLGPCPEHRLSFAPVRKLIKPV